MRIVLSFTDSRAREITYFLRRKYNSKAQLPKLAKMAIGREVCIQAEKEMLEAEKKVAE